MRRTELRAGDRLQIGPVILTLEKKSGTRARLSISTGHDLAIKFIPKIDGEEIVLEADDFRLNDVVKSEKAV